MKLRKALTITGLFFIILIVLGEFLLPTVVESALESRLSQKFSTPHVDVELSASPRLMLLLGRTDSLSVTVKDGQVGQLRVHEMALSGRKAVLFFRLLHGSFLLYNINRDLQILLLKKFLRSDTCIQLWNDII